ncbi:glutathione peroxidase [Parafilimonas sp.]|uniref:glutathione peroxidase n=1 Tax=Parafilimonas sp. TaxID=1969739 RepID=UPI0039E3DA6E
MTIRQKIMKLIYPLIMKSNKNKGVCSNKGQVKPVTPIYNLSFELNNGRTESLSSFKGKKLMIVNTASDCGYTNQYENLEKLYEQYNIAIIGFPANDFGKQEKGNDDTIARFCKLNYGVTFPLAKKSVVIKSPDQNKIFEWLSNEHKNGWLNKAPVWNFSKYLINEAGVLTHYFEPGIEPLSGEVINAVQS